MKIIVYEMKKIWSVKLILILALLCALFYMLFMSYYIEYFRSTHSAIETHDLTVLMAELYGTTIDDEELSEFVENTHEELIAEAEAYIADNQIFSDVGIYSYDDYIEVYNKESNTNEETDAIWTLLDEECDYVQFKLQALEGIEAGYQHYSEFLAPKLIEEAETSAELSRLTEIQETEEYRSIMSDRIYEYTVEYFSYLAILVVLAVFVLTSPLIVTDRAKNIHMLQYTTKKGRKILNHQFAAYLLSSFILTTVLIVVFGALFSTNGIWNFWNSGLNSFLVIDSLASFFVFNLTYGQYVIANVVLLYVMCMSAAVLSFALSRYSQNLITLILKAIPVFAVISAICFAVFFYTFSTANLLYTVIKLFGIEAGVCCVVFITCFVLSALLIRREKKVDII